MTLPVSRSRFHVIHRLARALCGVAVAAGVSIPLPARADATVDKINSRHAISVGVLIGGSPFGSLDPATQQPRGFNVDLANEIGKRLGARVELVSVLPSTRVQFLQQGKVDVLIANMEFNA